MSYVCQSKTSTKVTARGAWIVWKWVGEESKVREGQESEMEDRKADRQTDRQSHELDVERKREREDNAHSRSASYVLLTRDTTTSSVAPITRLPLGLIALVITWRYCSSVSTTCPFRT